jgi:hypothetical protein
MRRTKAAESGTVIPDEPSVRPGYLTLAHPQSRAYVQIKQGFIWPAFIWAPWWSFYHGMAGIGLLWIVGWILMIMIASAANPSPLPEFAWIVIRVVWGFQARHVVEAHYRGRGYLDALPAPTEEHMPIELDSSGVMVVRRPLEYGDGCPLCGYPYYSAGAAGVYKCDGCRGQFRVSTPGP